MINKIVGLTIVLLLLFLISVLIFKNKTEGFEDNIQSTYKNFTDFYSYFCPVWEKAVITSASLDIPQQPLESPSQITQDNKPPSIPISQLNTHIIKMKNDIGKDLPQICSYNFPSNLELHNLVSIQTITGNIPDSSQPYINALEWMNGNLQKSQDNLQKSLQGLPIENFQSCEDIQKCLEGAEKKKEENIIGNFEKKLKGFMINQSKLNSLVNDNQALVKNAETIKSKAESGQLLKEINIKDSEPEVEIVIPSGADKLQKIQKNNPERYDELKRNYPSLVSMKGMFDSINSGL
jgi:hypothetical protein